MISNLLWATAAALLAACGACMAGEPIRLHPENGHYFLFRGKPTILLTSAEHYGAVLNLDFDYVKYLDTLQAKGFNYTRMFSGAYCESPGDFGIQNNTLAPAKGKLLCPWARSDQAGYAGGGGKFDLTKWDDAYFKRLKDFIAQAGKRGVVVELSLFCPFYKDIMWSLSPMNAANNVNDVGHMKRTDVYTLKDSADNRKLLAFQDAMVRKIVAELKDCDNLFYEICNEPYCGGVSEEWQAHIAEVIVQAEKDFPVRHLIAQNIANRGKKINKPNPAVSIFNFHYAYPPKTVAENFGLNRVIGDDETGGRGSGDDPYRTEAWDFLIAGGGLYNNLDYGFTAAHPDGTHQKNKAPGSTTLEVRDQLAILREFMAGLDFIHMRPDDSVIKSALPAGLTARALVLPGKAYAVYVNGYRNPEKKTTPDSAPKGQPAAAGPTDVELTLNLPAGKYAAEWVNTRTGKVDKAESFDHAGGQRKLISPKFAVDVALRILAAR